MIEKIIRFITPLAWVTIAFVGLCELLTYMMIYHTRSLEYTFPVIVLAWIVILFYGRAVLAVATNAVFDKS